MSGNGGRSWQIAFWLSTGFLVFIAGASAKGYLILDSKIAMAEDTVRKEKNQDLNKIEKKIEKVEVKIDKIQSEQRTMREESNEKFTDILIVLEQIKANQNE